MPSNTQAQLDRDSHLVESVRGEERTWPDARANRPAVATAVPPPDLTRFKLPSSGPTRKWLSTTRALGEGLVAAAAVAEKKANEIEARVAERVAALQGEATSHRAEAVRLRNSARVISQLLEQVGIEPAETPMKARPKSVAPRGNNSHPLAPGRWSREYERCIDCGRTDRKHSSNGRCGTCDIAWRKRGKVDAS